MDKLKERVGNNLLIIVFFGSVARGDSQPDSDVDVQLDEGEREVHISPLTVMLEEYIEHKTFGIPVYYIIDEEGIVLYDACYNPMDIS